ncbi:MAG: hypothetical protein HY982_01350 [Candidatus Magasanikbacteria bacterium]|nr:hypothetical protein [Candidatus Magasanikbacteria bacterium]
MTKRFIVLAVVVFFVLSFLLYSPALNSFFVSDDFDWIWRAQEKSNPLNYFWENADGTRGGGVYRPLTLLSFWLNYRVGGLRPFDYHFFNVFFFAASAVLIFWLVWLMWKNKKAAVLSGLFFLVLPNHPEAVSWISGRGDVLAVFFALLSFIFYLFFRRGKSRFFLFFSVLSFFLSLLAKEAALALPAVLAVFEIFWFWKKPSFSAKLVFKQFCGLLSLGLAAALFLYLRLSATSVLLGFYATPDLHPNFGQNFKTFLTIFFSNFLEAPWREAATFFAQKRFVLFMSVFLAFLVYLWKAQRYEKFRFAVFVSLFLFFNALPVLPLAFSRATSEGERFAYWPSVAIAIFLGGLAAGFFRKDKLRPLVCLALFFALGYFSSSLFLKNLNWRKAGVISQGLIKNFGAAFNLKEKQGIVVLGLPDNFSGAQVLRNGFPAALRLFYPAYPLDMLAVKVRFNLTPENFSEGMPEWTVGEGGYLARGQADFFHGEKELQSLDYEMRLKNYDKKTSSGNQMEIIFTPAFLNQMVDKKIVFLAAAGLKFKFLSPPATPLNKNTLK